MRYDISSRDEICRNGLIRSCLCILSRRGHSHCTDRYSYLHTRDTRRWQRSLQDPLLCRRALYFLAMDGKALFFSSLPAPRDIRSNRRVPLRALRLSRSAFRSSLRCNLSTNLKIISANDAIPRHPRYSLDIPVISQSWDAALRATLQQSTAKGDRAFIRLPTDWYAKLMERRTLLLSPIVCFYRSSADHHYAAANAR